ncbi:MAG: hypothetical protein HC897_10485 [Thermoanaerobaculia bacterium]|nr:hypothetical protein [Thermoanaerobaculia bacterium]
MIGAAAQALILDPIQDFAENPPKFYEHPVTLSASYRINADINGDGLGDLLLTHAGMWDIESRFLLDDLFEQGQWLPETQRSGGR